MIEQDTIRLLRECDAGIRMGISSIGDVLEDGEDPGLRRVLAQCKHQHEALGQEVEKQLSRFHDKGKAPNPMAKMMSHMKTVVKMGMDSSDHMIADLMTDGCGMGAKSLSKYLNQYKAADETAKDIAKRLITQEEPLSARLRQYL